MLRNDLFKEERAHTLDNSRGQQIACLSSMGTRVQRAGVAALACNPRWEGRDRRLSGVGWSVSPAYSASFSEGTDSKK